ncbi:helix-turn-helix transcriptional regulator [Sutcliffiella horikoshii]|uniref:helix-turn-helix transcriptional regulator n=1 Tax=Sutcliffiella horikoshii TaxID=79883 RepID=UPI00203BFABE|nr:helix-turn-helix transcriptional regulator [Sutcliffiella horikoshii]MCM3619205.1 helix-turn-helix transcriptional regulator [Sutcliffiella horikoshii]
MFEVGRCLIPNLLENIDKDQTWLAGITGISRNQLSDYCNNRYITSMKNAKSIATALKCSIDDLYEWVPVDSSQNR